jgi:hypothetical protein
MGGTNLRSLLTGLFFLLVSTAIADQPVGVLPDGWELHSRERRRPGHVDAEPATLGAKAPSDAVVLFDGSDLDEWQWQEGSSWFVSDGVLQAIGDEPSLLSTRRRFTNYQLHLEFRTPSPAGGADQKRGNSGIFFNGKYEIQIVDNWENDTYADGWLGALFGQKPPLVDVSRPPGEWQSYDIVFLSPTFENGKVATPARITALLNGILVHFDAAFLGETTAADPKPVYATQASAGPLALQEHGDATSKVQFRNIWLRPVRVNDQ